MSSFLLAKPREADDLIARLFQGHQSCVLRAREDNAFKPNAWFDFGRIDLFPIPADRLQQEGMPEPDEAEDMRRLAERYTLAVKRGQYEWNLPEPQCLTRKGLSDFSGLWFCRIASHDGTNNALD